MAEPLYPSPGDLCWNAYWREFYVELPPTPYEYRVNWNLGKIAGIGLSITDNVKVHLTPFDPSRGDKVIMPWVLIYSTFKRTVQASYRDTLEMYRALALDAVRHNVHQSWTTIDAYAWPKATPSTPVPASTTEKRTKLVVGRPHPF